MSRVYVVDDHELVREGLKEMLRGGGHEIVGEAGSPIDALRGLRLVRPDIVILDVRLAAHSGFDVLRALQLEPDAPPVLMLTMSVERRDVEESLRLGARGYLLKTASRAAMLRAIDTILGGERHFGPELAALDTPGAAADVDRQMLASLSPREQQILEMVVRGRSSASIGLVLGLSAKTVDTYRSRLMTKINAGDVTALVRFAIRAGLLDVNGR